MCPRYQGASRASGLRGAKAVDASEAVCRDLPAEADRFRRRFWRDPEFRTVCEDYRDALDAAARFEPPYPACPARAEEYRQLAAELLAEARAMLEQEPSR